MKHEQREQTNQFNVILTREKSENMFQNSKYLSRAQKAIIKFKAKLSNSNKQKPTEKST
jgi:hypothetical protein